jgi:serine phosphatase RsbU (regulator of sigma subunit)
VTQSPAQNNDSLWKVYRNQDLHDSIRLEAFNDIAWSLLYSNPDSSYLLGHEELEKARELRLKKWESKALNTIGASYQVRGNFIKAIEFYQQSLKIREQLNDIKGVSSSLANIGSIYISIGEFEKALSYQLKSLDIFERTKNQAGMASALNNLGVIYKNLKDYKKALEYNERGLALYTALSDKQGVAACHDNIGGIYANMGDHRKALEYLEQGCKYFQELGDKSGTATILASIARSNFKLDRRDEALDNAAKGKAIAKEAGDLAAEKEATHVLYEVYKATGNKTAALENYERYVEIKDSIETDENQRAITNLELEYQYEKKAAADSVKHEEEQRVKDALIQAKNAELEQDKTEKLALTGGLFLLLISGGVMFNRFRIIRRQKNIIENKNRETEFQKAVIEEKQKEILASISYAKRLQEAILPPPTILNRHLPDSFILYKPKDIVAGDFYWLETSGDWIYFAAADSTGHGVPGAMVSVVCSNALNRSVKEFHLSVPGEILDKVRELVIETFEKSESEVNDGMDISLCAFNPKTYELNWAGANNPLWIIRKSGAFEEYKANKQAIGKSDQQPQPYRTHHLKVEAGDKLYLFTDGYADQFGGDKGKKLNYKNLQSLIAQASEQTMLAQKKNLEQNLAAWQGSLEQVDDILVTGIRIQ